MATLVELLRVIGAKDTSTAIAVLRSSPELAREAMTVGATRADPTTYWLEATHHQIYAGDTALHVAAAAHLPDVVRALLALGADVSACDRRGAQPLHLAADGFPGTDGWRPDDQAAVIELLARAGADVDATDRSGVAPLHRAVRTRAAAAVEALLAAGADPNLANGSGSTPMKLATMTTGRGGSGSPEARAEQAVIVELLREA